MAGAAQAWSLKSGEYRDLIQSIGTHQGRVMAKDCRIAMSWLLWIRAGCAYRSSFVRQGKPIGVMSIFFLITMIWRGFLDLYRPAFYQENPTAFPIQPWPSRYWRRSCPAMVDTRCQASARRKETVGQSGYQNARVSLHQKFDLLENSTKHPAYNWESRRLNIPAIPTPVRYWVFDNSNIMGTSPVSAMVAL